MAARPRAAGAHVTAIGRRAVEHLAADEFVPADISTVEGTDKVIKQMAGNGGADIIFHVAGGGAPPRPAGSRRSLQSYGTAPCSSTFWEQCAWIEVWSQR